MDFYRWRPHPWHGLEVGLEPPGLVNAYLEITPFDSIKYEIDKQTGYLRIDRPQSGSSLPPCSYGFIPQTYAGDRVAALAEGGDEGDGDPLDICLISEMPVNRAEVLAAARVLGGFCMIDDGAVDDKIIAVLENDTIWGEARDIDDLPKGLIERLQHYFSTYKLEAFQRKPMELEPAYGVEKAREVIRAGMEDYREHFPRDA
ncbi:MAG: inorganic pyrophosphatase [Verrucomicrobiota bacterium]